MVKKTKKKYTKKVRGTVETYGPVIIITILLVVALVLFYQKIVPERKVSEPAAEIQQDEEGPQSQPKTKKNLEPPQILDENQVSNNYLTATFSDSFSSLAWIDTEKTSLYFDWTGTNLLFPPKISVEQITASPLLDTFVSELVKQFNNTVVFSGHHVLNNQKALITWDRDKDTWKRLDFDTLSIPQTNTIISINPVSPDNQWLIFTKTENTHAFHVYAFDSDMKYINDADLGSIPQDISLACGTTTCLMYYPDSSEFFTLDMSALTLTREKELQNMVRQKTIDAVIITYTEINSPRWVLGLARENSFELWQYDPFVKGRNPLVLIFSQGHEYPGQLSLLPRADGRVFIVWASYFTHAYEIQARGEVFDLSARFGWRVSENAPVSLYEIGTAIYVTNTNGTIIRFDNELNARVDNLFWFNFSPSFLKIIPSVVSNKNVSHSGYVVTGIFGGGTRLYTFTDLGFDLSKTRQVVSKQINFDVKYIGAAQISKLESGSIQADIHYFLSNDGGIHWQETDVGTTVKFKYLGNDLRWKIKIAPHKDAAADYSPYLRSINFTYWYEK